MKLLYLLYLLKKTNISTLVALIKYTANLQNKNVFSVIRRMVYFFFKYNTAFLDYFFLAFYNKEEEEIATYADTLFMYRFQKRMNQKAFVPYFSDKKQFYEKFGNYINHQYFLVEANSIVKFKAWLDVHKPNAVICKYSKGQVGKGIQKFNVRHSEDLYSFNDLCLHDFYQILLKKKLDLVEINIEQHPVLKSLHPNSLNTIRVITVLDENKKVNILATILRIGVVGNFVDNFDAGGVSALVNIGSGVVEGPLFYKDPRSIMENDTIHPTTNKKITGVQLPFWRELIELVENISLLIPEIRTVGWDIAITEKGPLLLEGNQNWDKTHWQKVSRKGMKADLNNFK